MPHMKLLYRSVTAQDANSEDPQEITFGIGEANLEGLNAIVKQAKDIIVGHSDDPDEATNIVQGVRPPGGYITVDQIVERTVTEGDRTLRVLANGTDPWQAFGVVLDTRYATRGIPDSERSAGSVVINYATAARMANGNLVSLDWIRSASHLLNGLTGGIIQVRGPFTVGSEIYDALRVSTRTDAVLDVTLQENLKRIREPWAMDSSVMHTARPGRS